MDCKSLGVKIVVNEEKAKNRLCRYTSILFERLAKTNKDKQICE